MPAAAKAQNSIFSNPESGLSEKGNCLPSCVDYDGFGMTAGLLSAEAAVREALRATTGRIARSAVILVPCRFLSHRNAVSSFLNFLIRLPIRLAPRKASDPGDP